ncbi:MAG: nitroreductase family protein [Deltaproteobacteria bacterium]|nr:nitroreductase family protein [Deltaproteobacteria bacterium]
MIKEMVLKTRSIRRFIEEPVSEETLLHLIDIARLSASAANLQPLKYIISCKEDMNNIIFPNLKWAGYLREWKGPEKGERPSAYIIVMGDRSISGSFGCDHGIATQNILLGATELGLSCCIIGALDRKKITENLNIPEKYEILHIIAIGKAGEEVILEEMEKDGSVKYWRDRDGIHHVPKRTLRDILVHADC